MEQKLFRNLFCLRCPSLQFNEKYLYDLHLIVHESRDRSESEDSEFKWEITSKTLESKNFTTISSFLSPVHEKKKSFKCNICHAGFSLKAPLKRHINSVHKGRKPFKCNVCDASFSQKGHLN